MRYCNSLSGTSWPTLSVAKATRPSRYDSGCGFSLRLSLDAIPQRPEGDLDTSGSAVIRDDMQFQQLVLANFAVALVFMLMASTFDLFVTQLGFSAATCGADISFDGALIVVCELPLTALTRRFPARKVMALG